MGGSMYLIDGGNAINIALGDPITRCMEEEGVAPEDIIVDIIICQSQYVGIDEWLFEDNSFLNAWDIYQRREAISYMNVIFEDFHRVQRGRSRVDYRYVVTPHEDPPNDAIIPIFIKIEQVEDEIEMGYRDGLDVI